MKKFTGIIIVTMIFLQLTVFAASVDIEPGYGYERFQGQNITLNVYNWGLYISDGSDDTIDVNAEFERYTGIKVHYTTFASNEEMYTKIKGGGADYDVIFPSDYMIGKMAKEGLLAKLDKNNIPKLNFIDETFLSREFDPQNDFSVPYTWGTVGIVYNKTMVEGEVTSWNVLFDEKYKGNILMFNNSRDNYAIALKSLGKSVNPSSIEDVKLAGEKLAQQKPLVQGYVMDEIFDKMEGGSAAIAPYYAGDAVNMLKANPDLAFVIPKEGSNVFIDGICVPANSQNKEAAEMYINFLCETQVALANIEFIEYSTPHTAAKELLPDSVKNSPFNYPSEEVLALCETYAVLPNELNEAIDKNWSDLRSYDKNTSYMLIPVLLALAVLAIVIIWYNKSKKKKRESQDFYNS